MLIRIIILIIFISNNGIVRSQTGWINVTIGNSEYHGIVFPSKDTGFAFRNDGVVLKTIDKGNQWNVINTNSTNVIKGTFTNSILGAIWAIPPKLSTDGGINWIEFSNQIHIKGLGWLSGLIFINTTLGFAVGGDFYPFPNP